MSGKLARDVGRLIRAERERRELSQQKLAIRAGLDQGHLSRLERGRGALTTTVIERAFAAMGQQLTLDLEPLDSALDAQIETESGLTEERREVIASRFGFMMSRIEGAGLDYRIDGTFAAFLHRVPIDVAGFELAIAPEGAQMFIAWLARIPSVLRWSEKHRDFRGDDRDPAGPGPARWNTPGGEIRVRLLDRLPPPVAIRLGERVYPVLPLTEVAAGDPQVARVIERVGYARAGGGYG